MLIGGAELTRTRPSTAQPLRVALLMRPRAGAGSSYETAPAMELRMSKSEGVNGGRTTWLTLPAIRPLESEDPRSLVFARLYEISACRPWDIRRWNWI